MIERAMIRQEDLSFEYTCEEIRRQLRKSYSGDGEPTWRQIGNVLSNERHGLAAEWAYRQAHLEEEHDGR